MVVRRALIGFGLITFFYLLVLIWVDSKNQIFSELPKLASVLPTLMGLSLLSYLARYIRWYWLLQRAGSKANFVPGCLAYLSGFAFTATPGKIGELVRIRYFTPLGVPPWKVLAAFIYERAFDLLVVLALTSLSISRMDIFVYVLIVVVILLVALWLTVLHPFWLFRITAYLRLYRYRKLAHIFKTLHNGLSGCRIWITPLDCTASIILGLVAWTITSLSFVILVNHLGLSLPLLSALALYPIAMLAGALSMFPGGVGTTEVTIVALLTLFNTPIDTAVLAAVGIRLSSMWFAILCGFIAISTSEFLWYKKTYSSSR